MGYLTWVEDGCIASTVLSMLGARSSARLPSAARHKVGLPPKHAEAGQGNCVEWKRICQAARHLQPPPTLTH